MIALDASALLALLYAEPGADQVQGALSGACMCTVNLTEVLDRFSRDGHDPKLVQRRLSRLPITWVDFNVDLAEAAAAMNPRTSPRGLSLGDRACLALAESRGIPALTADRAWSEVEVDVEVRQIR